MSDRPDKKNVSQELMDILENFKSAPISTMTTTGTIYSITQAHAEIMELFRKCLPEKKNLNYEIANNLLDIRRGDGQDRVFVEGEVYGWNKCIAEAEKNMEG